MAEMMDEELLSMTLESLPSDMERYVVGRDELPVAFSRLVVEILLPPSIVPDIAEVVCVVVTSSELVKDDALRDSNAVLNTEELTRLDKLELVWLGMDRVGVDPGSVVVELMLILLIEDAVVISPKLVVSSGTDELEVTSVKLGSDELVNPVWGNDDDSVLNAEEFIRLDKLEVVSLETDRVGVDPGTAVVGLMSILLIEDAVVIPTELVVFSGTDELEVTSERLGPDELVKSVWDKDDDSVGAWSPIVLTSDICKFEVVMLALLLTIAKLDVVSLVEARLVVSIPVSELAADVLPAASELADVVSVKDDGAIPLGALLDSRVWKLDAVVFMMFSVFKSVVVTVSIGELGVVIPTLGLVISTLELKGTELVLSDRVSDAELCSTDTSEVLKSGPESWLLVLGTMVLEVLNVSIVPVDKLELVPAMLDVANVP